MNKEDIRLQLIVLFICLLIYYIRFGRKKRYSNTIETPKNKTYKHNNIKSDISTKPINPNEDIRYKDYLDSAWEEVEKK